MEIEKVFFLVFIFSWTIGNGQGQSNRKALQAVRTSSPIKIDGNLDESAWVKAAVAKNFRMWRPGNGDPISADYETTVNILYDDSGIYFGAIMKDPAPDKVARQYGARNTFPQADFFGIIINPYDDKRTEFEFFVMSTGVQADAISIEDVEDDNWNQVWESAVRFTDTAWIAEVKIPYSALRFPKGKQQDWALNLHRRIRGTNEQYSWNFIDKEKGLRSQQAGILTNLENISPPLRLSLTPYTFYSVQHENGTTNNRFSAGMDLKWGINDSYTLDAVLVPEFGQVAFDNDVLLLNPFEQQFTENRNFFTEGVNLFSIGNLFYSRRIGEVPKNLNLEHHQLLTDKPDRIPLINALKVSGRGKNGLGVGFFNAITQRTEGTVTNALTNEKKLVDISPLTNFNVTVLDQQFANNSSVSFVNTNVFRAGDFSNANVNTLVLNLNNRKNYFLYVAPKWSVVDEVHGFGAELRAGKRSGKYQFEYFNEMKDDQFEINDLGFQLFNNFQNNGVAVSYRIFRPNKLFNTFNIGLRGIVTHLFNPSKYTANVISLTANVTTKKQSWISTELTFNAGPQNDYRFKSLIVNDNYFQTPSQFGFNLNFTSDRRKKINYQLGISANSQLGNKTSALGLRFNPSMRLSDRFTIDWGVSFSQRNNEFGYVNTEATSDIFGNRQVKAIENTFKTTYYLNKDLFIDLSLRHFWSTVRYQEDYFRLLADGSLTNTDYSANHDLNYNSWNLNINLFWQFAPGSQLVVQFRNSLQGIDQNSRLGFFENLEQLNKQPGVSTISLKLLYFLDTNRF